VLERILLGPQGGAQPRMPVAERLAPPARDRVQDLAAVVEPQPDTAGAGHDERRKRDVIAHLAARVPERRQIARDEVRVLRGIGHL
jgi:hypothetical protein